MPEPVQTNWSEWPLITVVIASYNYGNYIGKAIESVLTQTYPNVELIVVDDGSTDSTGVIAGEYEGLLYIYQPNGGVSKARNTGIQEAKGEFIVFLDADDWLEPTALSDNFARIADRPDLAFVSGAYRLISGDKAEVLFVGTDTRDAYTCLLESNYIGMLAAVLFRTAVVRATPFDEQVAACEDYDLFLRIARNHSIDHHQKCIANYHHHAGSLSHQYLLMAVSIRGIIQKQEKLLRNQVERDAYERGLLQWKEYQELADEQVNHE